jgi:hypothetical protein
MGIWSDLMHKKAEDWTYLEFSADQVPAGVGHEVIEPNSAYLTLTLNSMRVVDVRRGIKRFYGAVHSWSSLSHLGSGRAEFQSVTTPPELKDADSDHLDRVISMERPLLGPTPYRGGGLDLELGLFSIASGELVGPFLEVLGTMARAAGVTFVSAALPFIGPLTQGISLLTGTARDSLLEIGLAKRWEPTTGYYGIVRAPRGSIRLEDLHVAADQRLVDSAGSAIRNYPYVVFSIEAKRDRPNWFEIADLKKAYDELSAEVQRGRVPETEEAFAVFRRMALLSPDLLFDDARVIADKVNAHIKEVMTGTQTAGGIRDPLPDLQSFSPFNQGT